MSYGFAGMERNDFEKFIPAGGETTGSRIRRRLGGRSPYRGDAGNLRIVYRNGPSKTGGTATEEPDDMAIADGKV